MKKKLLAILLAISFVVPLMAFRVSAAVTGDVDGDGVITLRDSAIIARHASGWAAYVLPGGGVTFPGAGLTAPDFSVGVARVEITPDKLVPMAGFGSSFTRLSTRSADPLYATCVALRDGNGTAALLFSLDFFGLETETADTIRSALAARFGIEEDAVLLACTRTHSGPDLNEKNDLTSYAVNRYYTTVFFPGILQAAEDALTDLAKADISVSSAYTDAANFVRRYAVTYTDSTSGWESDVAAKEVASYLSHETDPDEEVRVIVFERESADDVLLFNWQCQPDQTDPSDSFWTALSAGFVGVARDQIETDLSGVKSVFFQGAAGNLSARDRTSVIAGTTGNHNRAVKVGGALATAVEEAYAARKTVAADPSLKEIDQKYVSNGTVDTALRVEKSSVTASLDWCEKEIAAVTAWRSAEFSETLGENAALTLLYAQANAVQTAAEESAASGDDTAKEAAISAAKSATGLDLTASRARAIIRRVQNTAVLSGDAVTSINKTETGSIPLYFVTVGSVIAFEATPAELFDVTGTEIVRGDWRDENGKFYTADQSLFDMTFFCSYANGTVGSVPPAYAYSHGGEEVFTSPFTSGAAEKIARESIDRLNETYFLSPGSARKAVVNEMYRTMSAPWQNDVTFRYSKSKDGTTPIDQGESYESYESDEVDPDAEGSSTGHSQQDLTSPLGKNERQFEAGTVYPYVPYTAASASRFAFLNLANTQKHGVYQIHGLSYPMMDVWGSTAAGNYGPPAVGSNCADAVYWSWATIANSMTFDGTVNMTPMRGCLTVGNYTLYSYNDNESYYNPILKKTFDGWVAYDPDTNGGLGAFYETRNITAKNGEQTMYEAYDAMQPGDGCVRYIGARFKLKSDLEASQYGDYDYDAKNHVLNKTSGLHYSKGGAGHALMIAEIHTVRNANGTINGNSSYLLIHEQQSSMDPATKVYHRFSFYEFYTAGYLPITIQELKDADAEALQGNGFTPDDPYLNISQSHTYNLFKDANGTVLPTILKNQASIRGVLAHIGYSNYRVSSSRLTLTFPNGEKREYVLFAPENSIVKPTMVNGVSTQPTFNASIPSASSNETQLSSIQLAIFINRARSILNNGTFEKADVLDQLTIGENYHLKLEVQIATGRVVTVYDLDLPYLGQRIKTDQNGAYVQSNGLYVLE